MPGFKEIFPDADALLQLEPEDVGPLILQYLHSLSGVQALHRYNFISSGFGGELPGFSRDKLAEVQKVLSEGWNWLEREGLLAADPKDSTGNAYFITRRGQKLRNLTDFQAFKLGALLAHHTLDPVLAQKVVHLFIRGDYDAAVLQAYKEVEVRVSNACEAKGQKLPGDRIGVKLMFAAFDEKKGPLRDVELGDGERKAMANVFAGAIGLFKNPSSHRDVQVAAVEASELILFSNYLLRRVDAA